MRDPITAQRFDAKHSAMKLVAETSLAPANLFGPKPPAEGSGSHQACSQLGLAPLRSVHAFGNRPRIQVPDQISRHGFPVLPKHRILSEIPVRIEGTNGVSTASKLRKTLIPGRSI